MAAHVGVAGGTGMMTDVVGRFAPSPTGPLHLGSLRTALAAWMSSRAAGERFVVRVEDLDRGADPDAIAAGQLADLAALGIDWDGEVWWQRDRLDRYRDALADLQRRDLVYPCWCTRAEIRRAVGAPHGSEYLYPGTCRELPSRTTGRRQRADGRPPALRLRAEPAAAERFEDRVVGTVEGAAHDVVLQRNDGTPAYNLAVVLDDADQGITEVVRGADLLPITPTQLALHRALGLTPPRYAHVAMVVGPDGQRLATRDGAVTLAELAAAGHTVAAVRTALLRSLDVDMDGGASAGADRAADSPTGVAGADSASAGGSPTDRGLDRAPVWWAFDVAVDRRRDGVVGVAELLHW